MKVVILSGSEVPIRLYLTKALATPGLCYCEYLKVTSDQHPQRRNVSIDTFHGSAVLHKDSNMCVCVYVCAHVPAYVPNCLAMTSHQDTTPFLTRPYYFDPFTFFALGRYKQLSFMATTHNACTNGAALERQKFRNHQTLQVPCLPKFHRQFSAT